MSIASTESISASNQPINCPYCTWSKTAKYLFKHIYTNHYDEIYTSVGNLKKLQEEYDKDLLPRLNQTWEEDEEEYDDGVTTIKKVVKERNIWCCFGCSKTFFTNKSVTDHLVKGKTKSACYKEHKALLKRILVMLEHNEPKEDDPYFWLYLYPDEEIRKGVERYGRGMIWMMESSILPALKKKALEEHQLKVKEFTGFTPINPKDIKGKKALIEAYKTNAKYAMMMILFCREFRLEQPHNLCNHEERQNNDDLPEFPSA
jgi:hypothetical protein